MNSVSIKKRTLWITSIVWMIGLLPLIGLGAYLIKKNRDLRYKYTESKEIELEKKIYVARQSVYQALNTIMDQIESTTNAFEEQNLSALPAYLKKTLETLAYTSGIGVAFAPHEYNKKDTFHATYIVKDAHGFKTIDMQKYYNYADTEWYQSAFGKKITWMKPFLEVSTNTYVLRVVAPIYRFDTSLNTRIPIGVFFVDISRPDINMLVNKTIYDTNTYAFLMSFDNTLISYPIESYLDTYKTLFGISQLPGKKEWHQIQNDIERKRGGITTFSDSLSQESSWVAFEPLGISDWCIVYVTHQESLLSIQSIRHNAIQLASLACALILYLLGLLTYLLQLKHKKNIFVASTTLCFLSLTIFQLYLTTNKAHASNQTIIKSEIDLARFKDFQQQRDKQLRKPNALYIPTGIIINNLLMRSNNKLEVQGLIWQKYGPDMKNIKKEVDFVNTESIKLTELYQTKEGDTITIGWSFHTILNTVFDQSKYPFNILQLDIQLFHPNFEKNIILIPDFGSYGQHEIDTSIGISTKIVLEKGLHIGDSYFFYVTKNNPSSLGLSNAVRQQEFPDLSLQVDIAQGIVNPLIAYLLPLLIISLILFYILLEENHLTSDDTIMRISLLGQTAALFLALVFAHNSLRSFLKISTIAYLESYYFIIYAFTFLVASGCMLRSKKDDKKISLFVHFYHNLTYAYWPLIFVIIYIVTLYFFY